MTATRFRVRGDTVEIFPAYAKDKAIRVEFFGDEIDRHQRDQRRHRRRRPRVLDHVAIYPGLPLRRAQGEDGRGHPGDRREEMEERVEYFKENDKLIEAQRIDQRT